MQDARSAQLDATRLAELAKMGELRLYSNNEMLIAEGEQSDALFILVKGKLKVFTRNPSGREVVFNILKPRELFGEMFLDGGRRSASVKAMEASECIVLEESQFRALISKHNDFAECLIQVLIARLRRSTQMVKDLVLSDVYGRTIAVLNQVATVEGKLRVVPRSLTQQEIADRVGATREMINHVIGRLIEEGSLFRDERRRLVFSKALPSRE